MEKIQEIERLVEEAMAELLEAPLASTQKRILTTLARKCALINVHDLSIDCNQSVHKYNSSLRDGQVEEVKQEPKPALQPLPEALPDFMLYQNRGNLSSLQLWEKIRQHFGTQQLNLQPLPEKAPVWFMDSFLRQHALEEWNKIRQHFGTQPLEWLLNLKKGDKFLYAEKNIYEFSELKILAKGGDYICADYCSPYTDPTQSFRSKLTPEMQVEFDKLMEGK